MLNISFERKHIFKFDQNKMLVGKVGKQIVTKYCTHLCEGCIPTVKSQRPEPGMSRDLQRKQDENVSEKAYKYRKNILAKVKCNIRVSI